MWTYVTFAELFYLKIMAEQEENKPPQAIIRPDSPVKSMEGNQVVLDAEGFNLILLPTTLNC